jgi:CheY-like chemotaxis protein
MSSSSKPPRFPARILIVEDDPALREALAETLRMDGYEVHEAANGAVALEIALRTKPHIVVFDYALPVTDGPTLVDELRMLARPVPVLVGISGATRARDWCIDNGVPIFLLKPFADVTLRRAIDAAAGQAAELAEKKKQQVSGTLPVTRPACVIAVGAVEGDQGLTGILPQALAHARIVVVETAEEAERVLDHVTPDMMIIDDVSAHDPLRTKATLRGIPVVVRHFDGESLRRIAAAFPPPPSSRNGTDGEGTG